MNRGSKGSKQAKIDGLPPSGREAKAGSVEPTSDTPKVSQSDATGSGGGKKKKFSFFSNLFNKPSKIPENETCSSLPLAAEEVLGSSSSYESVNSVTTTNSFTFVSSKKIKGKGHKGKRIPVDEPTLPRPTAPLLEDPQSSLRPNSALSGGGTLGRNIGNKKLGTLSRIGVKIGLKKKYNLQSCESLENISTLPRQRKDQAKKGKDGKKNQKKKEEQTPTTNLSNNLENNNTTQISLEATTSNASPANVTAPLSSEISIQAEVHLSPIPSEDDKNLIPESKLKEDNKISQSESLSAEDAVPSTSRAIMQIQNDKLMSPSTSGYVSDSNVGSLSNSARRKKRAAPPPPLKSPNVILVQGKVDEHPNDNKNVELKSIKRLTEDDNPSSFPSTSNASKKDPYPSYPCGALKRNKSKEKSYQRPASCSCTSSIFAQHSRYQTLHNKKCCNSASNSINRTHVRGKKKAPAPPNPFDDTDTETEAIATESSSSRARNPENPYGNPFLDSECSGEPTSQVGESSVKTSCPSQTPLPHTNISSNASISLAQQVPQEAHSVQEVTNVPVQTTTGISFISPEPPSTEDAIETDEIAQNMLNDRQEEEQLASGQSTMTNGSQAASILLADPQPSSSTSNQSKRAFLQGQQDHSSAELEALLRSSPTLLAQAKSVDEQVKARLQTKQDKTTSLRNDSLEITSTSSPQHSPKSSTSSEETKATPRPWYKRGISSSSSYSKNKPTSPTKATFMHLQKFSDLDREAKQIVEENKRKSAEIAFNQNAKDLMNIYKTTCAPSSSTLAVITTSSSSVNSSFAPTSAVVNNNFACGESSSSPPSTSAQISSASSPIIAQKSNTNETAVSTSSSMIKPMGSNYGKYPKQLTTNNVPNKCAQVTQTSKSTTITGTETTSPISSNTSRSPSSNSAQIPKQTILSSQICSTSGSKNENSILTASPQNQMTANAQSQPKSPTATTQKKLSEDWICPRCTLKNPSWRPLCEACYYRKLPVVGSQTATFMEKVKSSSTTTSLLTTSSSTNKSQTTSSELSPKSNPQSRVSNTNNTTVTSSLTTPVLSTADTRTGINSIQATTSKVSTSSENFLNQLPSKEKLANEEKLQGMKLNVDQDEVDVERLREARLAFFVKDSPVNKIEHKTSENKKMNISVNEEHSSPAQNNLTEKCPQSEKVKKSSKVFSDGEDNFIDELLLNKKPPRPPKYQAVQNKEDKEENLYAEPNFGTTLFSNSENFSPIANTSVSHVPFFKYSPMLDPITEVNNYYSVQEAGHNYENWMQQPFNENESLNLLSMGTIHNQPKLFADPHNVVYPNTSAEVYPLMPISSLQMRAVANAAIYPEGFSVQNNLANFSPFTQSNGEVVGICGNGFDPGLAFPSNSHLLNSGFASESDSEEFADMERRRKHGYNNNGIRHLSYEDYRRMGAIPKGINSCSGSSSGGRSKASGWKEDFNDSRYFSESSGESSSKMENPVAVSKLICKLEWAIANGEHKLASTLAHDLALLKVNCSVTKPNTNPITIRVYVEDRFMQQGPFFVQVLPSMTLRDLKSKIEGDWGIPSTFQKWIISGGKKMADDNEETLASLQVQHDTMAFLYLVTPQIEHLLGKSTETPPPLPKKPTPTTSPTPKQSNSQLSPQNKTQQNKLPPSTKLSTNSSKTGSNNKATTKVASSCQTEDMSRINIKKPPMALPNEDLLPIKNNTKSANPISLYTRPTSPPREEPLQNFREDNDEINSGAVKSVSKNEVSSVSTKPTPSFSKGTSNISCSSSTQGTSTALTSPNLASTNIPPSLQAKLEHLRQVAEQAFGKSFQQSNLQTTLESSTNKTTQVQPNKTSIEKTVKPKSPVPVKNNNSAMHVDINAEKKNETTVIPKKSESKTLASTSILNEKKKSENIDDSNNKMVVPSSSDLSISVSEPIPKPRVKKVMTPELQVDIGDNKILNTAEPQEKVEMNVTIAQSSCKSTLLEKSNKVRVENYCQTTLPFPAAKPGPSSSPVSSTVISELCPSTTSSEQNSSKTVPQFRVANVHVAQPILSEAILRTSPLLQAQLFTRSSTTSPTISDASSFKASPKLVTNGTEINLNQTSQFQIPQPSTSKNLPPPVILRSGQDIEKPAKKACKSFPYFMKNSFESEDSEASQRPMSSKVKEIAQKFNSTPKTKEDNSGKIGGQQRKNSDSSVINMAIPPPTSDETVVKTINKEGNMDNYLGMLEIMEKQDLIKTFEEFECPVCLLPVPAGAGITLRDCLHNFCPDCLIGAVEYAEDSEVKCPFRNDNYSCSSVLQEREIKALVPPNIFEKYLVRSIKLAEHKMMNTFHCKTPDCTGWCIFEDDVNIFKCPVCKRKNCITCAAIHEGMDCLQYQRKVAIDAETDENAKSSRLMLENLIQRGEALECPACHVVLLKKWGCDWVRCTYCKVEICWITKGLRWGKNGKGDLSGGCKCGVNGIKCHPKCQYCH